jgi:glucose/sorbosone dehydrogenase
MVASSSRDAPLPPPFGPGSRFLPLEIDLETGKSRIYAWGLRNANGMAFDSTTGALWTVVNERDGLGDDVPPDYLTSVKDGGFYGWPHSYWGQHVDVRVSPIGPTSSPKPSRPTTRSAHTRPRWGSLITPATRCPGLSATACSSVSTAHGTAPSTAATR